MRCIYLLLFISGVVRVRAEISVKKLFYVEARVEVKDGVPGEGPSVTLEDLKKVLCLPGEDCQDKKSHQGTTYRPYDYPSGRPCGRTTPGPTQNPCFMTTRPYYPYKSTPRTWYSTPYVPYDWNNFSRGYRNPTSPRPTRHPWYTTTYRPYYPYSTTRRYWDSTAYRPYDDTTPRRWNTEGTLNATLSTPNPYLNGRHLNESSYRPDNYTSESNETVLTNTTYLSNESINDTLTIDYFDEEEMETPFDCSDLPASSPSGLYNIVAENGSVEVFCDMDTDGGRWTVIQNHNVYSQLNMNSSWEEYKDGFGIIKEVFWLGNKQISDMTTRRRYSLRVDLVRFTAARMFAKYDLFRVEPEDDNFQLHVGNYSGNAGDGLSYHNRRPFSTFDMDNDHSEDPKSCSQLFGGGWWYKSCYLADLNSYKPFWNGKKVVITEMKIRPADL